ncbi:unnamed protein product [Caenorhabditis angaria]|uniref:Uncharacterized protein n=1 Tax=Caenorhabditis angaria TaxID=860376 RepID=A0A9P1N382_9PELO|nr:unnamed protein product [Caenorhabditis angaria]
MQFLNILLLVILIVEISAGSFFNFGRKTTTTTRAPQQRGSSSSRCDYQTNQCSAYECCNSNQSCIKNRCFPRLSNCPVTRDQCGNSCCQSSYTCRNGVCSK